MLKTLTVSTKSLISFAGASRHTARLVARPRIGPSRLRSSLPQRQPAGGYQKHQRPPLPRYVYYLIAVPVCGGIIWVANLEEVPYTKRRRAILVSSELEEQLGKSSNQAILNQYAKSILPPTHKTSQTVQRVGTRLVKAAGLGDAYNWEFHVIQADDIMNAMAAPGGKVIVFTGLKKVVGNEEEMAAVLGHEISHVLARHGAESMTLMTLMQGGLIVLALLGFPVNDLWLMMGRLFFELPFSRTHELEADAIGVMLCAKACYNPAAAMKVFQRMEKEVGGQDQVMSFASTHPTFQDRLAKLEKEVQQANVIYEANGCWVK